MEPEKDGQETRRGERADHSLLKVTFLFIDLIICSPPLMMEKSMPSSHTHSLNPDNGLHLLVGGSNP